jgi:hypothetical protein
MSSLVSENGTTTLKFGTAGGERVEVVSYDGLNHVRLSISTATANVDVRFTTTAAVSAKLAQLFAEDALARGYSDTLNFDSMPWQNAPSEQV